MVILKKYTALLLLMLVSFMGFALPNTETNKEAKEKTDRYIKYVYNKISFKKINKLSYEAFNKAFYGYLNLKEGGRIRSSALLTICDFSLSSNTKRMWVINVNTKKVLYNNLVAHGMGSGEEYATRFSNIEDSHQSSLGFYLTGDIYQGENGTSLKLDGIDGMWNNKAFDRAIVVHGADYVSSTFASANNRLGRSHGCPALPREVAVPIINKIANGNVLFIYHPTKAYMRSSYWLNNPVAHLPQEADLLDIYAPKTASTFSKFSKASDSLNTTTSEIPNFIYNIDSARIVPLGEAKSVTKNLPNNTQSKEPIKPVAPVKEKDFLYMK